MFDSKRRRKKYQFDRLWVYPIGPQTPIKLDALYITSGFLMPYVMVFLVFYTFRWEVVVHFVDIGEIVDHHCLNFLFIINTFQKSINISNTSHYISVKTSWQLLFCYIYTSLARIPPILLKAGICIPYFSNSDLIALISSSTK